jgi:hypothetical protein
MNFARTFRNLITLAVILSFELNYAQEANVILPALPDFNLENKDGYNIISFYNNYENGVKAITVLRSSDSIVNFTTIGTIPQQKKGSAVFIDPRPMVGKNWYIVRMEFTSGVDFKSNLRSIEVDSATIALQKPIASTEELQKAANKALEDAKPIEAVVAAQTQQLSYPKSRYVYTNPFSGNIMIELSDALTANYKLEFYDNQKKRVVFVPRVNKNMVILDKRNFNENGLYSFKLYKNNVLFEEGFVSIY